MRTAAVAGTDYTGVVGTVAVEAFGTFVVGTAAAAVVVTVVAAATAVWVFVASFAACSVVDSGKSW